MKHGMMTVRPRNETEIGDKVQSLRHDQPSGSHDHTDPVHENGGLSMDHEMVKVSKGAITGMTVLSFIVFGFGLSITLMLER